jgi:hypothetical protein
LIRNGGKRGNYSMALLTRFLRARSLATAAILAGIPGTSVGQDLSTVLCDERLRPIAQGNRMRAGRQPQSAKARILLMLALTRTSDPARLQEFFDR